MHRTSLGFQDVQWKNVEKERTAIIKKILLPFFLIVLVPRCVTSLEPLAIISVHMKLLISPNPQVASRNYLAV